MSVSFNIIIQVPKTSPLAFSSRGISSASLANASRALNHIPALWIRQQIVLDFQQHIVSTLFRKSRQAGRKGRELDEL